MVAYDDPLKALVALVYAFNIANNSLIITVYLEVSYAKLHLGSPASQHK